MQDSTNKNDLWSLLEDYPAKTSEGTMIISDETEFTYDEFRLRCNKTVSLLKGSGIRKGTRVAVCLPTGHYYAEIFFALMKIGAVMACIRPIDSVSDLMHYVSSSGASAVIVSDVLYSRIKEMISQISAVNVCMVIDLQQGCRSYERVLSDMEEDTGAPASIAGPKDPCMVTFTAGTTGTPKMISMTAADILTGLSGIDGKILKDTKVQATLICISLSHINGWSQLMYGMKMGRKIVMMSQFSVDTFLESIRRNRITRAYVTPSMFYRIVNEPEKVRSADLSSLERLGFGYDFTPVSVKEKALSVFPENVELYEIYGMAETFFRVSVLVLGEAVKTAPDRSTAYRRLQSVGRLCAGYSADIVSPDGRVLPQGAVGEIIIRRTEDGLEVRTSDLGYFDEEGYLHLNGVSVAENDLLLNQFSTSVQNVFPSISGSVSESTAGPSPCIEIGLASQLAGFHSKKSIDEIIGSFFQMAGRFVNATYYGISCSNGARLKNIFSDEDVSYNKWRFSAPSRLPLYISTRPTRFANVSKNIWETFESVGAFVTEAHPEHAGTVPLLDRDGKSLGAIYFFRYGQGEGFSAQEQASMRLLAANIGVALENVTSVTTMQEKIDSIEEVGSYAKLAYLIMDKNGNIYYESPRAARGRELLNEGEFPYYLEALRSCVIDLRDKIGTSTVRKYKGSWRGEPHSFTFRAFNSRDGKHIVILVRNNNYESSLGALAEELTSREAEIASMLTSGATSANIARSLFISENTVKVHIQHIFQKLGVSSRSELLSMIYRE